MPELLTTGQAATLLNRQVHQVRRVLDETFPDTIRAGQNRLIRPEQLTDLATALAKRYQASGGGKMSDHTVSDLARTLQRSRTSITALITAGKLDAYDAAPDGRYRQWRVTPEALEAFRERHRRRPVAKPRKRIHKPTRQYV